MISTLMVQFYFITKHIVVNVSKELHFTKIIGTPTMNYIKHAYNTQLPKTYRDMQAALENLSQNSIHIP